MKNINPPGLFDEQFQLERLTQLKDPLVKLEQYIDWKIFAPILDIVFSKPENHSNAGRPPFDRVSRFASVSIFRVLSFTDTTLLPFAFGEGSLPGLPIPV
jgi:hypothetical protein